MDEKNFEFNNEEFEDEVSSEEKETAFEDFNEKESVIQKETEGFLMKLVPEKLKKEAVGLLAALSLYTNATSVFAEGFKHEEINKKQFPENQTEETARAKPTPQELFEKIAATDKNDKLAPFDWKKIADKIEISVGGEFSEISEINPEAIRSNNRSIANSDFYRDFPRQEHDEAIDAGLNSILHSDNSREFFDKLSGKKENLNDRQKVLILQYFGKALGRTYNYDMAEKNQHIAISDDVMFLALRGKFFGERREGGICGNIHTFLVKIANSLGVEAWLQNGSTKEGGHVWSGVALDIDGKKQIAFLDYETLVPSYTEKYPEALGIAERYHTSVAVFNSFVGNEKEVLFPVKSRAQEVIEKAAGIDDVEERLDEELFSGELKKEKGLEIKLSPEVKEIKLTKNTFALAYFDYQDVTNNPYQSLENLNALRGRLNLKGERFGLEADATVLHMTIKDLYNGSVPQDEIITRIAADYINSHKFTKSEFKNFELRLGATVEAALRVPLDKAVESSTIGTKEEAGAGIRLIYIDPADAGKFYIGAQEMFRVQKNDFQNQDALVKEAARTFTVGTEIKVNEAEIVSAEIAKSELDWGKKMKLKGGVAGKEWKGEIEYEKSESEYERFIPSSEKISAEIGYQGGPKYMIKILGSKTTEEYAGAESNDIYDAEVKLILFLW